jgi:hypothetical protein
MVDEAADVAAVGETEMIADPKRKPHQDEGDGDKRRRQEEALDEALENTFPASDPVSVEQPTTTGAPVVPEPSQSKARYGPSKDGGVLLHPGNGRVVPVLDMRNQRHLPSP